MELDNLMKERYSCKKYLGKEIDDKTLTAILEAGNLAPTAKNAQEQKIYVAKSDTALKTIDAATPCRYGAPVVLVVAYDENGEFTYPGNKYHSGAEDASIVATHMMLKAKDLGVDSCWVNFYDPDKLAESLNLPKNEHVVLLLDLGYADEGGKPLENHFNRKKLEETVKYI